MIELQYANLQDQQSEVVSAADNERLRELGNTIIKRIEYDLSKEDTKNKLLDEIENIKSELPRGSKFVIIVSLKYNYTQFAMNKYVSCTLQFKIYDSIVKASFNNIEEPNLYAFHSQYEDDITNDIMRNIIEYMEYSLNLAIINTSDIELLSEPSSFDYNCIVTVI